MDRKKSRLETTEWIPIRKKKKEKSLQKEEYKNIEIEQESHDNGFNEDEMFGPKRKMDKVISSKEQVKQCEKNVVGGVMHRYKRGDLHSGKTENIVQNKRQAIAIALSIAKKQCKLKNTVN